MNRKRALTALGAGVAVAALVVGTAAAGAPRGASLVIRHQVRGCHTWSLNGGAFKPAQAAVLRLGGVLKITNNDVMPHTLVKSGGPAVRIVNLNTGMVGMGMHRSKVPGAMANMGASTRVTFSKPGVYRFTTKPGEDYMQGMKTIGEDYVLKLQITVK
jgi:plastocyanin